MVAYDKKLRKLLSAIAPCGNKKIRLRSQSYGARCAFVLQSEPRWSGTAPTRGTGAFLHNERRLLK